MKVKVMFFWPLLTYFNRGLKIGGYGHDIYMVLQNCIWQIQQSLYIQ